MIDHSSELSAVLSKCESIGIRLSGSDDGQLSIDAPEGALTADLLNWLKTNKTEVLAHLQLKASTNRRVSMAAALAFRRFDWDSSRGHYPCKPLIRMGVHHKREDCVSGRAWRHVWGERYCAECWPCTDPRAEVDEVYRVGRETLDTTASTQ